MVRDIMPKRDAVDTLEDGLVSSVRATLARNKPVDQELIDYIATTVAKLEHPDIDDITARFVGGRGDEDDPIRYDFVRTDGTLVTTRVFNKTQKGE
jgi:hypothetical protein